MRIRLLGLLAIIAGLSFSGEEARARGCVPHYSSGPGDPPITCTWDGQDPDSGGLAIYYCSDGSLRALSCEPL